MRTFAGGFLLLVVGAVFGWWLRGTALPVVLQPRAMPVTTSAQAAQIIAASSTMRDHPASQPRDPAKVTAADRLRVLAAINRGGRSRYIVNAIAGNKLDDGFIEMYGLTDTEVASLNASLAEASRRMTDLAMGLATAHTNDEDHTLAVHVPPFPDAGGVVHDQVFAAFKAVLGPERYDAFNVLSADGLENSFNAFGLNDTTYTMKLTPTSPGRNGDAIYDIEMKYTTPLNNGWGNSRSTLQASTIPSTFPILAHYVPPGVIPPKK